ncbi:GIY-YIG nuclease family protein [Macrococcus equipercicus]|uniref:GIY-YIG nuclease family protein n=1 Tax=Macrococcus equipercicus TaxID=69967 RepID=A0A9Q9F282_9STAP|nr:GIY-YIG nuclease family protein [Macrococcus equipercicus]UTH14757.1 GIY-YIG nuclease family protein [Macrococcus equipercicus]
MMEGKVYCITNKVNKKQYIGITTRDINQRFKEHQKADSIIGKAIRKYGSENFVIQVIDYATSRRELFEKEIHWIALKETFKHGYNLTHGGDGVNNVILLDVKLSEKQKRFVNWVKEQNKKEIDVMNSNSMIQMILINFMQLYLIAERENDKRKIAKNIITLKESFKKAIFDTDVINRDELTSWAV